MLRYPQVSNRSLTHWQGYVDRKTRKSGLRWEKNPKWGLKWEEFPEQVEKPMKNGRSPQSRGALSLQVLTRKASFRAFRSIANASSHLT